MVWPNFLAPAWGWLGLLAVPLIALYLLRQKRPDKAISSTLLWNKALADMRASTPFQKFRRNLQLFLQLLILAALVFALMRPVVRAQARQVQAGVIVIDASASMQTLDGDPENHSRLERAKTEARTLVNAMRPGDRYMMVTDGGGLNHRTLGFTDDKADLLREIDAIKTTDTPSDLSESLLLAVTSLRGIGGANENGTGNKSAATVVPGKVWLLADGDGVKLPDHLPLTPDGKSLLQYIKIGQSDHSVGITRLSVTPLPKTPHTYQVFVGIQNAWNVERKVGVLLAFGSPDHAMPGQAQFVTIPAHGSGSAVFEKVETGPGKLFVRLDDTDDDFPLDNTAYALIEEPRKVNVVLSTTGSIVLQNFIKTAVHLGQIDAQIVDPPAYGPGINGDLFIFDGFVPTDAQLPEKDTLLIRPTVKGAAQIGGFDVTATIDSPAILRTRRDDPLMQYVELSELRISQALLVARSPEITEVVSAPETPLIAYRDAGPIRRYWVGFSPQVESNWWMQPSLLIFLQNVIDQTRIRHSIGMPEMLTSGSTARLWNITKETNGGAGESEGQEVHVRAPDGVITTVIAHNGVAEYPRTDKAGFYDVTDATGKVHESFAVNLLNAAASDISPKSLETPENTPIEEANGVAEVNQEVWPWVAAIGLGILLLEWFVYHRRIA